MDLEGRPPPLSKVRMTLFITTVAAPKKTDACHVLYSGSEHSIYNRQNRTFTPQCQFTQFIHRERLRSFFAGLLHPSIFAVSQATRQLLGFASFFAAWGG